jgi:type I restriction enzyme S subunit
MALRQEMPFEDIFEAPLRNGLTKPKAVRGEGMKMVNMGEVFAHRRIHNLDMDRVPMDSKERNSSLLRRGDLLFARQSLVLSGAGKCVLFQGDKEDVTFESHIIRCRLDQRKAEPAFYFYLFQSSQGRALIESIVEQVAAAGIRGSDLGRLVVPVPPLAEQKAIAAVLGALDDKIELNRRMNATLETMARALFQSWFVDFDPVRAKLDGRPPAGLDPATAALFPDSFQDSELGHIPKVWQVKTADEISVVGIGKTPPRKEHQWFSEEPADVPWMSIRDLGEAGVFISKTSEFLTPEAVEKFRVRRIPDDTVVLSFKLTMGRVAITDGEMLSNEAIAHFRLNPETPFGSAYLYCYLKGFGYDQLGSTSSIATAINSDMVRGIKILVPSKEVADAFERTIAPLFAQMKTIQSQSRTLATLRDTLLPKLLNGELQTTITQ